METLQLPEAVTPDWIAQATVALDAASREGPQQLKSVLPAATCIKLLERCQQLLHAEPTLLEVGGAPPAGRRCPKSLDGALAAAAPPARTAGRCCPEQG